MTKVTASKERVNVLNGLLPIFGEIWLAVEVFESITTVRILQQNFYMIMHGKFYKKYSKMTGLLKLLKKERFTKKY